MAECDILLTTGRDMPCKGPGGVKAFYLINRAEVTLVKNAENVITDIISVATPVPAPVFEYWIKSATNLIQTLTSSAENRTTGDIAQIFTGILHKMDYVTNNELLLQAYAAPYIVVHLFNGDAMLMGYEFGTNLDTAVADTGSGMNEFQGYTLTCSAKELQFANFLAGSTTDSPFAGLDTPAELNIFTPNAAPGVSPVPSV